MVYILYLGQHELGRADIRALSNPHNIEIDYNHTSDVVIIEVYENIEVIEVYALLDLATRGGLGSSAVMINDL